MKQCTKCAIRFFFFFEFGSGVSDCQCLVLCFEVSRSTCRVCISGVLAVSMSKNPLDVLRSKFVSSIGDFFASLPPRAVTMETDCISQLPFPPLKPIVELSFCQDYIQPPKVRLSLSLSPSLSLRSVNHLCAFLNRLSVGC